MLLLNGCQKIDTVVYPQKVLQKPEKIVIRRTTENNKAIYDEGSQKYIDIYEIISKNWWKYSADLEYRINDENLVEVETLEDIKTKTKMRYSTGEQITLSFLYGNHPISWITKEGESTEINKIEFILPKEAEENMCIKGIFVLNENVGEQVGNRIYAYYYSDDLFNTISDHGKVVKTIHNNNALDINADKYEEITVLGVRDIYINKYAWTNLKEHRVFWNWKDEQVVINHVFSKEVSEETLGEARDYTSNIELYKGVSFDVIGNSWSEVPNDAEVVIQVFKESELISQDIYSEVECGIPYQQIHYTK